MSVRLTPEEAQKLNAKRQGAFQRCRDDILFFFRGFGSFENKDDPENIIYKFLDHPLWDAQIKAILSIQSNKLNVIMKARQLGFSWISMNYVARELICYAGRTAIGLSKSEEEAKELVRRLGVILRNCPLVCEDKMSRGFTGPIFTVNTLEIIIKFPEVNGKKPPDSNFKAFPSSPSAGRSFTANIIVIDEWAFQQYAEEIWTSAFPTVNRIGGGKVIGLSTNIRGSFFESIFTDERNGFNKIFIPWYADPSRDEEWYKSTKANIGDKITQDYPATIEEALNDPGGSFFPEVCDEFHITDEKLTGNLYRYVCLDYGLDMLSVHWIAVNSNGDAQVYRELDVPDVPISTGCREILDSLDENEIITSYLGPDDLSGRDQITGKMRTSHFYEAGINLMLTSRNKKAGCSSMKEWLKPPDNGIGKAKFTILKGCAPNLYNSLKKVQKNVKNPDIYESIKAHDLTHDLDSIRCFCIYWLRTPDKTSSSTYKKWRDDQWEDYNNANEEDKKMLINRWGEPL